MMEREKILKETDDRLAQMENSHRDSVLKGRGFSVKLNIGELGKQKSDKITEKEEEEEDDLLNDDDGFSQLEDLENKISLVSLEDADAMLVTE